MKQNPLCIRNIWKSLKRCSNTIWLPPTRLKIIVSEEQSAIIDAPNRHLFSRNINGILLISCHLRSLATSIPAWISWIIFPKFLEAPLLNHPIFMGLEIEKKKTLKTSIQGIFAAKERHQNQSLLTTELAYRIERYFLRFINELLPKIPGKSLKVAWVT